MHPARDDVAQMVNALLRATASLERARRQGDAATLSLLFVVGIRRNIRPSEIAAELGVHQSTVTRQIQALEQAGKVTATADPADGRSCFIALTPAGRREIERLTEIGLARFTALVADWDAADVRTLTNLLSKLEESKARLNLREQQSGVTWRQKP